MKTNTPKKCEVPGCEKKHLARGLCAMHYERVRNHGEVGPSETVRHLGPCEYEGCGEKHYAKGWCRSHYWTWFNHGQPVAPTRGPTEGHLNRLGYREIRVGENGARRTELEHRYVMSQMIGRELYPGEQVHHINGVRSDNRPENLELWVTSQPAGQRPEDLVEWAKEILKRYDTI